MRVIDSYYYLHHLISSRVYHILGEVIAMQRRKLLLGLITMSMVSTVWGAEGIIKETPLYTFVYAGKDQVNTPSVERFDYTKRTTPLNGFVIAAQGGENTLTIKGDPTLVDDLNRPKYLDGSQPKKPAHLTIDVKSELGTIEAADGDYVYETRNEALKYILTPGGLAFSDLSNTGKNHVTLENVSIANHIGDSAIFINDQNNVDIAEGSADTNITLKGHTYLRTDGAIVPSKERNGIAVYKNTREGSKTTVTMDKDSSLDIYVKSGSFKSRGIGITHYYDIHEFTKDMKAHKTEMDFHGPVNITLDRNNQGENQSYGVGVVSMPVLENNDLTKDLPDDAVARVTFHNDLRIHVEPVLKDGKPSKIGDAINVNGKGSKVEIKGTGTVQIKGDIHVLNGAVADVNLLNKDSFFEGEAHMSKVAYSDKDPDDPKYHQESDDKDAQDLFKKYKDKYKGKDEDAHPTAINLTMKDGARWTASNSSKIKNLDISKGSSVVFSNDKNNITISVGNLKGEDSLFKIQGNIVNGTSDKLIIRKSSEGKHFIEYIDDASAPTVGTEKMKLVEYKPDAQGKRKATFDLSYGATDQGAYEYILTRPEESKIVKIESNDATKQDFYLNPSGRLSSAGQAVEVLHEMIYQSNITTMGPLVQRLGEIHYDKYVASTNDVWLKTIKGKYLGGGTLKLGQYDNNYRGLQGGYDWQRTHGQWVTHHGLELGYMKSLGKLKEFTNSINLSQYEFGAYSTWFNTKNHRYVDVVGRLANYSGSFTMLSRSNQDISSNTVHTKSLLLSAEIGQPFYIKKDESRQYYVEPEVQVTYHTIGGYNMYMSNGLSSVTDDFRSLLVRTGIRLGVDQTQPGRINPYLKFIYEKEWKGFTKHTFNKVAVETPSKDDSWFTYGLGFTYENKHKNTQIYFETQASTKHKIKQSLQFNLGFRHNF